MRTAIRAAVALLSCVASLALAQDYEREKRWADEVVPGVVVGEAVWIGAGSGRKFLGLYTPAREAKAAVVIVHGLGVHPDFGVNGVLRSKLADLGYTTLSIQMPVLASVAKADDYAAVMPDAIDRIGRAGAWLRERSPNTKLVLVTHSVGAWMGNVYLEGAAASPYRAWVSLGRSGPFTGGVRAIRQPTLDVYADDDFNAVIDSADARRKSLAAAPGSKQLVIPGTDHYFARKEDELARAIDGWLAAVLRQKSG